MKINFVSNSDVKTLDILEEEKPFSLQCYNGSYEFDVDLDLVPSQLSQIEELFNTTFKNDIEYLINKYAISLENFNLSKEKKEQIITYFRELLSFGFDLFDVEEHKYVFTYHASTSEDS